MKITVKQQETDGDEDTGRGWVEHTFTKRLAQTAANERQVALSRLLSKCKQSSDAGVVACLAEYMHWDSLADFATGKWGKHENGA